VSGYVLQAFQLKYAFEGNVLPIRCDYHEILPYYS